MVLHAPASVARAAAEAGFAVIASLDARLSDYRPDSVIRRIGAVAPDPLQVDGDVLAVIEAARRVAAASGGAFDPTVAPVVALWRRARADGQLPASAALASARALVDWRAIDVDGSTRLVRLRHRGMQLDLGGIAKGFILQEAIAAVRSRGVSRVLIEAGGDIVAGEAPPGRRGWVVGAGCGTTHELSHSAFSTSGATMQFVEIGGVRYSHVIDPRSGQALTTHHTVHVWGPNATQTDAWATALSVLGPDDAVGRVPAELNYCFVPQARPTARPVFQLRP